MRILFDLKHSIYILSILLFFSCAGSKKGRVIQEKPPGFIGQFAQNTTSRYNAYYNSELLYTRSMTAGAEGYRDNFDNLLAASVQDAIARDGNAEGNMSQIIQKTATMIEKKPYAKWVDDHFLLNGIAQYIKGDYEMAERIFRYTSSEYKFGVNKDRTAVRQKERGISDAKKRKLEAKEKIKAKEAERERLEEEENRKADEREEKAKKREKKRKVLSREEQFKAKQKAKKEGRDASTSEIVKEIKERNQIEVEEDEQEEIEIGSLSDEERETIANAPTLKNNQNGSKESKIGHKLAAKDAMLWLAKTYITTEDFIAAQAVLTNINEDAYFPERLNTDFYLANADMHIRLNNLPKAAEYIQLAADSAKRKQKGRLYYLLGQIYSELNEWELATAAFEAVEKYHPYYDMIYHSKMELFYHALETGELKKAENSTKLRKMIRDAKNDEFHDELYYFLGRSYQEQDLHDLALQAFQNSLEASSSNELQKQKTYLSLADEYYAINDFEQAQPAYQESLSLMTEEHPDYAKTNILSNTLLAINEDLQTIHTQDSLLQIAELPIDEQLKLATQKANKKLRKEFQKKLNEENESFGTGVNPSNSNSSNQETSSGFYFYDMQQSAIGYSEFKQKWGNRPNVDNWRRNAYVKRVSAGRSNNTNEEEVTISSQDDLVNEYLSDIPNTEKQKQAAYKLINDAYWNVSQNFILKLGDYQTGKQYLDLSKNSPNSSSYLEEANNLATTANQLQNNQAPTNLSTQSTDNVDVEMSEIETLYAQTYYAFETNNYEKALELASSSEKFQNNNFSDKFAFIKAISKGNLEGTEILNAELQQFIKNYPNSPLKAKALEIIK